MIEEYNQEGVNAVATAGRAIPGQSLTANPDEPRPFEQPPEFTDFREAFNYLAEELLEPEIYEGLVTGIGQGVPITDVTLQILQVGFQEGKWNPDLLMMLIEPTMYLLMALCEKAGVNANKFIKALSGGFADGKILQNHGKRMIKKDFSPKGKVSTHLKDMNNILECANDFNTHLPISNLIQSMFKSLVDNGNSDDDHSALYKEIENLNKSK